MLQHAPNERGMGLPLRVGGKQRQQAGARSVSGARRRFEQIVLALHEANFGVGAWATRIIEDVKKNRDSARAGPADAASVDSSCPPSSKSGEVPKRGRLSSGVGRMARPAAHPGSSAYAFRAGSSLPEDPVRYFNSDLFVVSNRGELFGIESRDFRSAFGKGLLKTGGPDFRTIDVRSDASVARDRRNRIVLLGNRGVDCATEDFSGMELSGNDPVDRHAATGELLAGAMDAGLDGNPELAAFEPQHRDAERLLGTLRHRLHCPLVRHRPRRREARSVRRAA